MRVISGIRKKQNLIAPKGLGKTRPTTDRVKESVFNIIQGRLSAGNVLDLFCGSGGMGIEALSRGCSHAVFVDTSPEAVSAVRENLQNTRFTDVSSLLHTDALKFLAGCNEKFGIIFVDPPYNKGFVAPVFKLIADKSLLAGEGIIVLETEAGGEWAEQVEFECIREQRYGSTVISIWRMKL